MDKSTFVELQIDNLSPDGRGVGFLPGLGRGKAVFVPGAMPGQIVQCSVVKNKKNWAVAKCEKIIAQTPDYSPPICSESGQCGACPLQSLSIPKQLYWKEHNIFELMRRIGNLQDFENIWQKPAVLAAARRNKIKFAFGADFQLGFRKSESHEIIPVLDCAIVEPQALAIKNAWLELAKESGLPPYINKKGFWRFLILRKDTAGWSLNCVTSQGSKAQREIVKKIALRILRACPDVKCVVHEERYKADMLDQGEKRIFCLDSQGRENPAAATLLYSLGGKKFQLDMSSFFQVNNEAAHVLARMIYDFDKDFPVKKGELLDLYCGVGAPGQLLAENYTDVLGFELDARAVRFAAENARLNNLQNCQYACANLSRTLPAKVYDKKWSAILVDPPRNGLSAAVIQAIKNLAPEKIIYVSCNAASMARDIKFLKDDYVLARASGVDMFPHTPHLECVGIMLKM